MKTTICLITMGLSLTACQTQRTKYKARDVTGGYSDGTLTEKIKFVKFDGNANTKKQDVLTFANFRAVEMCKEEGRITQILETKDLTRSSTVQKSSTANYQQPTYFSGNSQTSTTGNAQTNAYGNSGYGNANTNWNQNSNTNLSGNVYGGGSNAETTTWNETYVFPSVAVEFLCSEKIYLTGVVCCPGSIVTVGWII